jgi:hypothetical protein
MIRYQYVRLQLDECRARDMNYAALGTDSLKWVVGDELILRCFFEVAKGNNQYEAVEIAENAVLELGAKKKGAYSGALLVYSPNAAWNVAGDWNESNRAEGRCSVRVNLLTKPLMDLLPADTEDLTLEVDVCITEPGRKPSTVRFEVTVMNQALALNEGEAEAPNPDFATLKYVDAAVQRITTPAEGQYKIENGKLYLWDIELLKFIPVALSDKALVPLEE